MPFNSIFDNQILEYLESIPADDRADVLEVFLKYYKCDMSSFDLFAILNNKDSDYLKGKKD